jgi:hypothetical protein
MTDCRARDLQAGDVIHLGLGYDVTVEKVYVYPALRKVVVVLTTGHMMRFHLDSEITKNDD